MRIAIYHNLHSGGAKRALSEIAHRLAKFHELDLYTLSCADLKFCDFSDSVQNSYTVDFKPLPSLSRPFGRLNYAYRLIDLYRVEIVQKKIANSIDQQDYDVVYLHPCQFTQAPILTKYLHTPSLYQCQEPLRVAYEPDVPRPYKEHRGVRRHIDQVDLIAKAFHTKRKSMDRMGVKAAKLIVTNSHFTREAIYRAYEKDSRVVYLGIDAKEYQPASMPRSGGIVSVGALTPLKGFDFIIKSLGVIPTSRRPHLTIASNYQELSELEYLQNLAASSGVNVAFLSMVNEEVLRSLYQKAQIVVCASILEPFGLVPLEAMATATPVIAVAEGGLRESIVPEVTGLLVDRDPQECAAAIIRLLDAPNIAEQMGRNGRKHVEENWTWEKTIQKIIHYLEICSSKKAT